jgi:hypothetical protein
MDRWSRVLRIFKEWYFRRIWGNETNRWKGVQRVLEGWQKGRIWIDNIIGWEVL